MASRDTRATRRAVRAGSWYEADTRSLGEYLTRALNAAEPLIQAERSAHPSSVPFTSASSAPIFGPIGPHAGLSYCGVTSACAYARLRDYLWQPTGPTGVVGQRIRHIFLIGPSHRKYFEGVSFPSSSEYQTPFGSLQVDRDMQRAVEAASKKEGLPTSWMTTVEDEDEHSLELHLPFLGYLFCTTPTSMPSAAPLHTTARLVPIVVGDMDAGLEQRFGAALAPLIGPESLFIVSSDFCHWGERFRYTYRYKTGGPSGSIGDSIEAMDREAMRLIERNDVEGWGRYMAETGNTICGRHAIASVMHALLFAQRRGAASIATQFLHYSQSSRCEHQRDSSVSYAAAVIHGGASS